MNIDPRMNTSLTPETLARIVNGNPHRIDAEGNVYALVRGSFISFHEKRGMPNDPPEKLRYQGTFLFPNNNIGVIVNEVKRKAKEFYPNADPERFMDKFSKNSAIKDQALMVSTKDGGRNHDNGYAGFVPGLPYVVAKSARDLRFHRRLNGQTVDVIPDQVAKEFYSGCWMMVKLNIYKSSSNGNPGPIFGLQGALKICDDTPLGGGAKAATAKDWGNVEAIEDPNAEAAHQPSNDEWNDKAKAPAEDVAAGW